ncbi:helix-turn-helix transcriptional regulator [Nitrosophilus alvini]|uniref:helix-turn-helix transcriptional regulator n=1 Tax=Nitrosophilus alvini TaxID=2714855 RepID=UPI00190D1770|nr:WYL domain-containing protein [Nitrosophilus alvini]
MKRSSKAKDYNTTLTRLIKILKKLQDGETLQTKNIAEEFQIDNRTAQRYINDYLSNLVELERIGRGVRLKRDITLDDKEQFVIDTLEKMAEDMGSEFYSKAHYLLKKLKNFNENPVFTKILMEDISDKMDYVLKLEKAIKNKNKIGCRYSDTKKTEYILHPLKIANFEGYWYLIAVDNENGLLKKFHLKSIKNIEIKDETFAADKNVIDKLDSAINVWFQIDREPFEIRLFLDPIAAKYFQRLPISKNQKIIGKDNEGSIEISFKITHEMEIIPLIKSWIPHIIVLEPDSIAKKIKEDVENYLKLLP